MGNGFVADTTDGTNPEWSADGRSVTDQKESGDESSDDPPTYDRKNSLRHARGAGCELVANTPRVAPAKKFFRPQRRG